MFAQRFSATRRGARLARRLATHRLDLWHLPYGSPASDTVTLVVAELAANAILHGCVPGRDFELRLTYDRSAGLVRVEVSDTHPERPEFPDPAVQPSVDADSGRGLLLVEAVADRWGVVARPGPTAQAPGAIPVSALGQGRNATVGDLLLVQTNGPDDSPVPPLTPVGLD